MTMVILCLRKWLLVKIKVDIMEYHIQSVFSSLYFVSYHLLTREEVVFGWEIFIHQVSSSPMCELVWALQPDREYFCCTQEVAKPEASAWGFGVSVPVVGKSLDTLQQPAVSKCGACRSKCLRPVRQIRNCGHDVWLCVGYFCGSVAAFG